MNWFTKIKIRRQYFSYVFKKKIMDLKIYTYEHVYLQHNGQCVRHHLNGPEGVYNVFELISPENPIWCKPERKQKTFSYLWKHTSTLSAYYVTQEYPYFGAARDLRGVTGTKKLPLIDALIFCLMIVLSVSILCLRAVRR